MVGEDAVIKLGSDIDGAIAGITAVEMKMHQFDKVVAASAAKVRAATAAMVKAFAVVGVAAGAMAAVGLATSISAFEEFEQTVANAASVTGTFGEQFQATKNNIEDMARTLAKTTVFSAQDAADALYDVASMGYNVTDMVSGDLKPVLDLAAATQEDLRRTTEHVTASLGQFGLEFEESSHVADVFAKAIGSSKATLEKLGLSMKYAGTIASQYGNSVEEVSAALGVMYNSGLRGEQAGRSLRMSLGRLASPTAKAQRAIEELGLSIEDLDPGKAGNNIYNLIKQLKEAGMTATQGTVIFGKEAQPGIGALIENFERYEELMAILAGPEGSAADMAKKQLDTLRGTMTLLKSAVGDLQIVIGKQFAPILRNLYLVLREITLALIAEVEPAFNSFWETVKDLEPAINAVFSIMDSLKGIMEDVFDILPTGESSFDSLKDAINDVTVALAVFFDWIDKHPQITKFIVTLGLAVITFSYLYPLLISIQSAWLILTGVLTGSIPVLSAIAGLVAAINWPIVILTGVIAVLAAAWITNFGGIRDYTKDIITDIVDGFWWMMEQLFKVTNKLIEGVNKIRESIGLEPTLKTYDVDKARKGMGEMFEKMGEDVKGKLDVSSYLEFDPIDIEDLRHIEEYTGAMSEAKQSADAIDTSLDNANDSVSKAANTWYEQFDLSKIDEGSKPRRGVYATPAKEYSSREEVQKARDRGELKPGDVFTINIESVNTKSDEDNIDEVASTVSRSVSPMARRGVQ